MNEYYNKEDSAKRVEDFKKAVNIMEKAISKAFFNGYGLMFKYHKIETGEHEQRMLLTVSDIKYNDDDEILVGGCINNDGDYRQFFMENMMSVKPFKYVSID
jgi:agmatine/peptidylarginine deiminase